MRAFILFGSSIDLWLQMRVRGGILCTLTVSVPAERWGLLVRVWEMGVMGEQGEGRDDPRVDVGSGYISGSSNPSSRGPTRLYAHIHHPVGASIKKRFDLRLCAGGCLAVAACPKMCMPLGEISTHLRPIGEQFAI